MIKYKRPLPPHLRIAKRWLHWRQIPLAALAERLGVTRRHLDAELNRICMSVSGPMFHEMIVLSGLTAKQVGQELSGMVDSEQAEN